MKQNMQCWLSENLPEVDFVMMLPLTHYGEKVMINTPEVC